jgi:HD-GYP domain-containing protein (c-di-GMP phosphodiesterase class II)
VVNELPAWRELEVSPWPPGADDDAVARLLDLVEEAVPDAAAHMERTAQLAQRFGLELELPDTLLVAVVRTARLHDIGKLAIPPYVLDKPGPLSEPERRLMRAHAAMGQKILERSPALMHLAPFVRSTHERWDGNGYPDRLKGTAIPLPSRIVSLCDAFDAMTNARVYRGPITMAKSFDEIRRGGGSQFDPGLVEPFCESLESRIDGWAIGA